MTLTVSALLTRNGRYYFRISVPPDLKNDLKVREIKKRLRVTDLNSATELCNLFSERLKKLFCKLRKNMIPKEKISTAVDECMETDLELDEEVRIGSGKRTPEDVIRDIAFNNNLLRYFRDKLMLNDLASVSEKADEIVQEKKFDFKKGSPAHNFLCREILKKRVNRFEIEAERLEGKFENPKPYPLIQVAPPPPLPPLTPGFKLKELCEKFYSEKKISSWSEKTEQDQRAQFNLLIEVLGDVPVRSITRHMLLDFRDNILLKLPANRTKIAIYKGKTAEIIVKMKDVKPMSITTANDTLVMISSFFKWCSLNEFTDKNIGEGLTLSSRKNKIKAEEIRKVYEKKDIEKILANLPFTGQDKHRFWIPIIAMFSGMRQNEIAQLYKSDIVKKEGILCFDINDTSPDKKLKNKASARIVPVHPLLLNIGFEKYLKSVTHKRIWPTLKPSRDGYGQHFQRWYGRFNRYYVTNDKRKVFHSFRHGFANTLKQTGVQESIISELMGHANESITTGRYGKSYEPKKLFDAICKLDFGIDVVKILKSAGYTP